MDRTERLLRLGYLPLQLPPPFTTADLAAHYTDLYSKWIAIPNAQGGVAKIPKSTSAKAELFSVVRAGHRRRATAIPNPIAQTYLSVAVVDNWKAIVNTYRKSKISASRPRFRPDTSRAAILPSMQALYEKRLLKGAGFRFVLRTDVSRFFPTIYTHSIPWALHGKTAAKKQRKVTPKFFGNLLDLAVRQCQDGQTFGLLIGPDTSHIIAECIATAVDVSLSKRLKTDLVGIRYVDDYFLFFETYSEAENALSQLVQCLNEYELEVNFDKTKICRTEDLEEDSWTHRLRNLKIDDTKQRQNSDINHYFEIARDLARRNVDESVMIYALRRISSVVIHIDNWPNFEAHLCLVAAAHAVTLQSIARIFTTYAKLGYPISKPRLTRLMNSLIAEHASLEHHSEVAWCMWMCKDLELVLSVDNVDLVASIKSSVCCLILLDMAASGTLSKIPPTSKWSQYGHTDALWDEFWMLSYEAGIRGWGGLSDAHIISDPHFNELRLRNIHFYDPNTALPPLFSPKPNALEEHNVGTLAELLKTVNFEDAFDIVDDSDIYGVPPETEEDEEDDF